MGDDYMSALDEILASTEAPSTVNNPPPMAVQQQPQQMQMKSAKEMLGDRLRTQMGGEKRKLEDPSNGSELMSKTQKMDSDLDAVAAVSANVGQVVQGMPNGGLDLKQDEVAMNGGGNGQKLLAKALMKGPPPGSAASMGMGPGMGMKQPPPDAVLLRRLSELHKEQKHEEIKALLNEHPQLMQKMKMHQQHQQQQQQQQAGMNRMNNNMMTNDNMIMNNDNFYGGPNNMGGPGPQGRMAMQQQPHPRQNMGGGQWGGPPGPMPNGMQQNPAMYNQHKMAPMRPQGGPQRGGFFNEGGPPPNAWVQPNDHPNKMMSNGPPPAYYNRNGHQPRPPMMRAGSYENFNGGPGGQMYHGGPGGPPQGPPQGGNMRGNYHPNMDPYVNSRFGSPNNVNPPIFSPNNGGNGQQNNDSMHSLRMSANFPNDSNAGYNGYNNEFVGGPANAGNVPNNFNNPANNPRMRPGNFVNQNMVSPAMYNRVNIPQSSPMNEMNNMGFQPQQQQPPQLQQQQQQNFMNGNFDPNFPSPHANGTNGLDPSFGDLANGGLNSMANELINTENEWKSRAGDVRQTLLSKLKEALTSQNYPNAIEMAENYEERSFINANSLQDYQYKLVEWLACIYDSANNVKSGSEFKNLNSPIIPDSSTIGLSEVTTSGTSPKTTESNSDSLLEAVSKDDLLATPKSENGSTSCLSPNLTSPQSTGGLASSPANSTVMTTVSNNSSMSSSASSATTTTSSTMSSNSTFQCPVPPSQQSEINDKSSVTTVASSMASSVTATPTVRPTSVVPSSQNGQNGQNQPQQQTRRISGSGSMQQPGLPISSIGNNPQSVDSGIGLGSPRSITSGSSSTLYSPKIQGTSPSLLNSDNSPEKATNSS